MDIDETQRQLREIPLLAAEAHASWIRGVKAHDYTPGARVVINSPVLADLDRLMLLGEKEVDGAPSVAGLVAWAVTADNELAEAGADSWLEDGQVAPELETQTPDLATATSYLSAVLPWMTGRGWDTELVADVSRVYRALRALLRIGSDTAAKKAAEELLRWRQSGRTLTAQEASEELGIPVPTVYTWVTRKQLVSRFDAWDLVRLAHPDLVEVLGNEFD